MSELKEILTSRQLLKHHQLMRFLTQNPDVRYTLAQIDYLLPSGPSVQRFPEEWLELLREGRSGPRNVEVIMPGEEEEEEDEYGDSLKDARLLDHGSELTLGGPVSLNPSVAFICRQPAVNSLAELATLLEGPATVQDVEGCVGLHTSQIRLPDALLCEAQRRGLAYYLSEAMQSTAIAAAAGRAGAGGRGAATAADASNRDLLLSTVSNGGGAVPCSVLRLPPGVRVRYRLLTHRGLTVQDTHCIPAQLHVGERLQITFDNENACRRAAETGAQGTSSGPPLPLRVSSELVPIVLRQTEELRSRPPIQIAAKSGSAAGPGGVTFTKVQLAVAAVRAEEFRLTLRVRSQQQGGGDGNAPSDGDAVGEGSVDCVVDFAVVEPDTRVPGVLIARERAPSSFLLPPDWVLADPAVGGGVDDPTVVDSASNRAARVLPWWQSSSPTARILRDAVYPSRESADAAAALVFSKQSRTREARLREAKRAAKAQQAALAAAREKDPAGSRKDQGRRFMRLRNVHLLHFGLDALTPYVPPPNK